MKKEQFKSLSLCFVAIIGLVGLLTPTAGYDDSYKLLMYRDVSQPTPGNSFTLYAKLYVGTTVIQDASLKISSWDLEIDEETMENTHGLFSYLVVIPGDFEQEDLYLSVEATVGGVMVAIESHNVELQPTDEPETLHAMPQRIVKPGEILSIYSYMPEMADGRIINGNVTMEIDCDLGPLASSLTATYSGNGVFGTTWQVPAALDLADPRWDDSRITLDIEAEGLITDSERLSVALGEFFLFVDGTITGNSLELTMETVTPDYWPESNVDILLTLDQRLENGSHIIENKTAPPTDSNGRSQYSYELDETCSRVIVRVQASKGDAVVVSSEWIWRSTPSSLSWLSVVPTLSYIDDILAGKIDKFKFTFQATLGENRLSNAEIVVYQVWTKGIIEVANYTTSDTGEFHIVAEYPRGMSDTDEITFEFSYYNGTAWLYSISYLSLTKMSEPLQTGDKNAISLALTKQQTQTVAEITITLPSGVPFISVRGYAIFEEVTTTLDLLSSFYQEDLGGIPQNGKVSYKHTYPNSFTPRYFLAIALLADTSEPTGYSEVTWILDGTGKVLEIQRESSESEIIPGLTVEWTILTIFLLAASCMGWQRQRKKL